MKLNTLLVFGALLISVVPGLTSALPMSDLQISKYIYEDARKIFGQRSGNLYDNDVLISETISEFLSMPEDGDKEMLGRQLFITGCRVHSCKEKGAVFLDTQTHRLSAVALLHYRCRLAVLSVREIREMQARGLVPRRNECDKSPNLEMYVLRRSMVPTELEDESLFLEKFRSWAAPFLYEKEAVNVIEVR